MDVGGQAGDFSVALRQEPRYVDPARCINCNYCSQVCPVELPNTYQQGMSTRKAAYKVSARAAPDAYVIDRGPYAHHANWDLTMATGRAIGMLGTAMVGAAAVPPAATTSMAGPPGAQ